ncbi:hypothetical protein NZL82_15780 [Sphingomonas sanguinis]|nr:hypothetical protein [Sphingomonas sp. LC-1]
MDRGFGSRRTGRGHRSIRMIRATALPLRRSFPRAAHRPNPRFARRDHEGAGIIVCHLKTSLASKELYRAAVWRQIVDEGRIGIEAHQAAIGERDRVAFVYAGRLGIVRFTNRQATSPINPAAIPVNARERGAMVPASRRTATKDNGTTPFCSSRSGATSPSRAASSQPASTLAKAQPCAGSCSIQ